MQRIAGASSNNTCQVLLITTCWWPAFARLAHLLTEAGCDVGIICPTGHPARSIPEVTVFEQRPFRPMHALSDAIRRFDPVFLIPGDERALHHLHRLHAIGSARERQLIERSLGPPASYPVTTCRVKMLNVARQSGVPVPAGQAIDDRADLNALLAGVAPSWILKLDGSWGGMGVCIAATAEAATGRAGFSRVVLSDTSGLLATSSTADVFTSGEGTNSLTLTGNLGPINTALASLTYQGSAAGSEYVWVSATDPQGLQGSSHVVVTDTTGSTPPVVAALPVVTLPAAGTVTAGASVALSGVSVADSASTGRFSVTVSDSAGLLNTAAASGVTISGENSTALTLTGSLAAINADLASLSYQAGTAAGADWVWVSASDASGNQGLGHEVVTVTAAAAAAAPPVVTLPAAVSVAAGSTRTLAGVSVADGASTGSFTVTVSDSTGLLKAAASGVAISGAGSTALTLTGSLTAINADLASLSYQAGSSTGADWLWVSARDPAGKQGLGHEVVSVTAAVAAPPVVTGPASLAVTAGQTAALAGVKVSDGTATGSFSVTVSDSAGLMNTAAAAALTIKGENSTSLTLTGGLAAINADLASLTYGAGKTAGTDWLWVSADDPSGAQGLDHVVVSVAAAPAVNRALALEADSALCFCAGTRIATARGSKKVELLRIGDLVRTLNGAAQRIQWIGTRCYGGRFIAGNPLMLPVCIKAGAMAPGIPARDLFVSPGHAIHVDGRLVPAWRLLNGVSITQAAEVDQVTYYHVELARHDVIFAEGCPVESFLDEGHRAQFQNGYEAMEAAAGPGLKRTETGFALEALRRRLAGEAGVKPCGGALMGYVDQAGPGAVSGWGRRQNGGDRPVSLDVRADGRRVARVLANLYRADLRAAGMGDGCHGFEVMLPAGMRGRITVHGSAGGEALDYTRDALARAA